MHFTTPLTTLAHVLWNTMPVRRYHTVLQHSRYDALVRGLATPSQPPLDASQSLLARAPVRRALPCTIRRTHVAIFGLEQWEQFGLWPSFSRLLETTFFNLGILSRRAGVNGTGPRQRRALATQCLTELDALDRRNRVHIAFFYADSECLEPSLFDELARRGIWTVLLGLDDKHRFAARTEHRMLVGQAMLVPHVDLYWTTWRLGPALASAHGGNGWYAPEAADPTFHRSLHLERDIDVLFLGQRYGERTALVHHLRHLGIKAAAFGQGWPGGYIAFEQSVRLINRARLVLGMGGVSAMSDVQHLKGRDFEVPMCEAAYLTSYTPELSDWFDVGSEILCYTSRRDCAESIVYHLAHEDVLAGLRTRARTRCLQDHTWDRRLQSLLALFPRTQAVLHGPA